ncbi:hypothetical protein ACFSR7_05855 [Cohnella sp. GCM10020058]|uniref:hypothetical protein n=1 Tax=Cohnella sp. GCM10020058 TaxID=3317330 RepID=UPI00363641F8
MQLKAPADGRSTRICSDRQPGASDVAAGAVLEELQLKAQACGRPWHPDLQRSSARR